MSRIPTPASIDAAPAASQPLLEAVKKQLGLVPNMFRLVANSPAALEGYLGLSGALNKGALPAPTRERIALAVAGDQFINSEATRERLHREFGGRAVAMEGGALAQVADWLGLPWLEVRALSDLAGHELQFDFGAFVDEVARNSAIILRRILPVL